MPLACLACCFALLSFLLWVFYCVDVGTQVRECCFGILGGCGNCHLYCSVLHSLHGCHPACQFEFLPHATGFTVIHALLFTKHTGCIDGAMEFPYTNARQSWVKPRLLP